MNLKTYLFMREVKLASFARLLGYSYVHIWRVCQGRTLPSLELAKMIEERTNGEVSFDELMETYRHRNS